MKTPTEIVIRYFAILALAFVVGSFVIRPLMRSEKPKSDAIKTNDSEPLLSDFLTNDPYVIVFRAIEARYTSDTNGPSTYTAYVPNGPALQMIYTNQASPAVSSITLYMTNLTAFSNRLTIY